MDWLIVVPVWGARCHGAFENATLPAIRKAIEGLAGHVRFLIHTDKPTIINNLMTGLNVECRAVPPGKDPHHSLGDAHRQGIAAAKHGECIAFINADMVCSVEMFAAAEARFVEGKRLIMLGGTRTIGAVPPIGAKSADLLLWTMQHAHPAATECFYGTGRSGMCATVYFKRGNSIVLHAWHLHPFALLVDRVLKFDGATIDRDLQENYKAGEIHVVTDANEAAFAEMSPPERVFGLVPMPIDVDTIMRWTKNNASHSLHPWFFEHAIAICGDPSNVGDSNVVAEVLRKFKATKSVPNVRY